MWEAEAWMEILLKDLRYAAASLARRPWFTAAAVLCLGLGLGAASAIFTLVDAVLLRALPYDDPQRIVVLWNGSPREGIEQLPLSAAEFLDLREGVRGLSALAATIPAVYSLTGEGASERPSDQGASERPSDQGAPERLSGMRVSATLTEVLGVRPALGRAFRSSATSGWSCSPTASGSGASAAIRRSSAAPSASTAPPTRWWACCRPTSTSPTPAPTSTSPSPST